MQGQHITTLTSNQLIDLLSTRCRKREPAISSFSSFYGVGTNMHGELVALRDGLQICQDLHAQ